MESELSELVGTHYRVVDELPGERQQPTPFHVKLTDTCRDHAFCYVKISPVSYDLAADKALLHQQAKTQVARAEPLGARGEGRADEVEAKTADQAEHGHAQSGVEQGAGDHSRLEVSSR